MTSSLLRLAPSPTVPALVDALFGPRFEQLHQPWAKLFGTDAFRWQEGLNKSQRAALSYDRLRIVNESLVSPEELVGDIRALTSLHEWSAQVDGGLTTLAGIHYNLFLGSLMDHESRPEELSDLLMMRRTGTFLCTELAHGNSAVQLETTATHEATSGEFVLHTPNPGAQKFMPNTSLTGGPKTAVVAARLIIAGRDEGVFLFLVPLSDEHGFREGVRARRLPEKTGSPVDHCLTSFDRVRLPSNALLGGAHGRVSEDGVFSSEVGSRRLRFLTGISRVTAGKLCMSAAGVGASRLALALATRYAHTRHTAGLTPGRKVPLFAYRGHHARLLEATATLYAATLWHREVVERWARHDENDREECERLVAVAKGWITWQARDVMTECRERCGAQGLFLLNGIAGMPAANEGTITAEGDNLVVWTKAAGEMIIGHTPPEASDIAPAGQSPGDSAFLQELLGDVERIWLSQARAQLRGGPPRDPMGRWNGATGAALEAVGAFARRQAGQALYTAAVQAEDAEAGRLLGLLHRLFALRHVSAHSGVLLAQERMTAAQVRALTEEMDRVVGKLVPHALTLTEGFAIPESTLESFPLGRNDYLDAFERCVGQD
ncbi:acyl-CoA dehydrogenase [Streptomyces sp. MUM 16J]|uniref:acyl-CoA dehydrogenase family protein n=1 Tax=Streptomyces sp. MUM 16J TaxID=2791988 RepID=UPI001F033B85|nr:acyl-CoA dehydrogenase [Streptomyces sp. MUM 16J]